MPETGIALDIGTSGIRALALDRGRQEAIAGAATAWHPIPGFNILDHLLFAATFGADRAQRIVIRTVNTLIRSLELSDPVETLALCGNPGQLALFTGTEARDLLFSPAALRSKGIEVPDRNAVTIDSGSLGLEVSCDVLVPPAIRAEVGADALALIRSAGLPCQEPTLAIDLGTNAELALSAGGEVWAGSAAAGPAIEGQQIRHGMLAAPGAIAGIEYRWGWTLQVLDERMQPREGDTIDLRSGELLRRGHVQATGITGTGLIALVSAGLATGVVAPPRIHAPGERIRLQDGLDLSEADLVEAGKAFGAIRAGEHALAAAAGISPEAIVSCHLAGTAGAFVDPLRARDVGLVPPSARIIVRHGNTSLGLAADLACGQVRLSTLQVLADSVAHIAFSTDSTFRARFLHELAYWGEGAPPPCSSPSWPYPTIQSGKPEPAVHRQSLIQPRYRVLCADGALRTQLSRQCPHRAISDEGDCIRIDLQRCFGAGCLACHRAGLPFGGPLE